MHFFDFMGKTMDASPPKAIMFHAASLRFFSVPYQKGQAASIFGMVNVQVGRVRDNASAGVRQPELGVRSVFHEALQLGRQSTFDEAGKVADSEHDDGVLDCADFLGGSNRCFAFRSVGSSRSPGDCIIKATLLQWYVLREMECSSSILDENHVVIPISTSST